MTESEYLEFHLETTWELLQKLNINVLCAYDTFSKEIPSFYIGKEEEKKYHQVKDFEEFKSLSMKYGKRLHEVVETINKGLSIGYDDDFLTGYLKKVILESKDEYSKFFFDKHSYFMQHAFRVEYLQELLPEMSYEKSLHYFNTINKWHRIYDLMRDIMPTIKELSYGQDLLYIAIKNCSNKEGYKEDYLTSGIKTILIDNYSEEILKRFDFIPDIKSYLENRNKPKNIILNEDDEIFTTRISLDCSLAKDVFYFKNSSTDNYIYVIEKFLEHLKNENIVLNGVNVLDANVINQYNKDEHGREKDYIATDIFVDTKQYNPNFKKYLSNLINKYFEDSLNESKIDPEGMDWDKFTSSWILKESLQSDLTENTNKKTKPKKM